MTMAQSLHLSQLQFPHLQTEDTSLNHRERLFALSKLRRAGRRFWHIASSQILMALTTPQISRSQFHQKKDTATTKPHIIQISRERKSIFNPTPLNLCPLDPSCPGPRLVLVPLSRTASRGRGRVASVVGEGDGRGQAGPDSGRAV